MTLSLSIVTPSLNQRHYLRQCVASVRAQSVPVSHLVADGASTDGTLEDLQRANIPHRAARDGGMYEALNAAIPETTGELLGYLNCDDLLLPWTAALVQEAFQRHPGADLVVGDALELTGERMALTIHPPARLLHAFMKSGGYLAQPAVFFTRRLFDRLRGFDTRYRLLADHDFWLRALKCGARVVRVWEVLAVQRMVEGQLMQKHAALAREEAARIQGAHGVHSRRRSSVASAVLHRLGMVAAGVDHLAPAPLPGPWPRARHGGLVEVPSTSALLNAMVRPSASLMYLRPGSRAASLLYPEG